MKHEAVNSGLESQIEQRPSCDGMGGGRQSDARRASPDSAISGNRHLNRVQSDMRHFHVAFGFGGVRDLGETRFKILIFLNILNRAGSDT
ncbi:MULTISPECIES: hypothetical protein [unclassified Thiocapsa]|uniref:hypothetical protein n=1 Tax=unclassified Thiocapsa TaxID=2641286 RepID=UPI0035ADE6CF